MGIEVTIPALAPTVREGRLLRWLVREGDHVAEGAVLAEVETDKAAVEVEAPAAGRVVRLLVDAGGAPVPVETPIALIDPVATPAPARQTVREALHDAIAAEMQADPAVIALGEAAGPGGGYGVLHDLRAAFGPERVIDLPPTHAGVAGLAIGAAMAGLRPVVEIGSMAFALQALDQIVHVAAKTRAMSGGALSCPLVVRGPNGAAPRAGPQLGHDLAAWAAHVPGLAVVEPWDAADAMGLLRAAIRSDAPVLFLESEALYGQSFPLSDADREAVPDLGRARIRREGTDVTVVASGALVGAALTAAGVAAREGISAEVIDLRCLRPLDTGTVVASVKRTGRCIALSAGWPVGSMADRIAAVLVRDAFDWLDAPVLTVTAADLPTPYAETLERAAGVTAERVVAALRSVTGRGA